MADNLITFNNKHVINFLVEKRYRFIRHLLFLSSFLLFIYNGRFMSDYSYPGKYYALATVYLGFISMFYLNMYVLVPRFFLKARYISYFLTVVLLATAGLQLIITIFSTFLSQYKTDPPIFYFRSLYEIVFIVILVILVTTMVKLLQRWIKDTERIAELRMLTHHLELNGLKNQINPHFLFNMLNNVKVLIRKNPEMATTVIMKLSDFLRYQLYGNNEEKVALAAEITFLSNFLNLEKIRRDNFDVNIVTSSRNCQLSPSTVLLPPNLFTTFVENAVKHSHVINESSSYINLVIEITEDKVHFTCTNSIDPAYNTIGKKHKGLGLINIRRRLSLLYADSHEINILAQENEYIVNLSIPL